MKITNKRVSIITVSRHITAAGFVVPCVSMRRLRVALEHTTGFHRWCANQINRLGLETPADYKELLLPGAKLIDAYITVPVALRIAKHSGNNQTLIKQLERVSGSEFQAMVTKIAEATSGLVGKPMTPEAWEKLVAAMTETMQAAYPMHKVDVGPGDAPDRLKVTVTKLRQPWDDGTPDGELFKKSEVDTVAGTLVDPFADVRLAARACMETGECRLPVAEVTDFLKRKMWPGLGGKSHPLPMWWSNTAARLNLQEDVDYWPLPDGTVTLSIPAAVRILQEAVAHVPTSSRPAVEREKIGWSFREAIRLLNETLAMVRAGWKRREFAMHYGATGVQLERLVEGGNADTLRAARQIGKTDAHTNSMKLARMREYTRQIEEHACAISLLNVKLSGEVGRAIDEEQRSK